MNRPRRDPYAAASWPFPLPLGYVLVGAAVAWVVLYAVFAALEINVMQGAAAGYWQASDRIGLVIDARYLPVYPALINAVNDLLPALNPALLMQLLSLGGWLLSIICVYLILQTTFVELVWQGTLLYAVFPLVGVFEIVYPRADGVAAYLLTFGLLAFLHKRRVFSVIALALALLTHPATWLVVLIISLSAFVGRRKQLTGFEGLLTVAPLVIFIADGARRTGDPLWWLQGMTNIGQPEPGRLLVFDGLLSLLQRGDALGVLVLAWLVILIGLALLLLLSGIWRGRPWLLALILPVLVYAVILNRESIWIMARYSVFLVLPLWVYLDEEFVWQIGPVRLQPLMPVVIGVAFASQLLTTYAVYTGGAALLFTGS